MNQQINNFGPGIGGGGLINASYTPSGGSPNYGFQSGGG
jgi:hypothetical protein